jgi:hypothetical protein
MPFHEHAFESEKGCVQYFAPEAELHGDANRLHGVEVGLKDLLSSSKLISEKNDTTMG